MARDARIPRRRGGLCGLLLVLLGAWSALVPFIGPYFRFAYHPDQTWTWTTGRLYLSVLPGAAAVLAGLMVMGTRSRSGGVFGGALAAAAGAWLLVGTPIARIILRDHSIRPGTPALIHGPVIGSSAEWMLLERVGFFTAAGALIIFFGAIAVGRFSMLSAADAARAASAADDDGDDYDDPDATRTTGPFASSSTGQFPAATGPYPGSDTSGDSTAGYASSAPFPPAPRPDPETTAS